jgi:hypothetical protein
MVNLVLRGYIPLKEAARRMGLTYAQALSYIRKDVFPTATKIRGTRWHVHTQDIEDFILGRIDVGGRFKA